jgi:hypothetical protein
MICEESMNNPWDKIVAPKRDVSALRADPNHPLDIFWAKDHLGRYLFVYEYSSELNPVIKHPPNLVGIETASMAVGANIFRLVLILKEKSNWQLFFALCGDLINATKKVSSSESATSIILQRLRRWQSFLKKNRLDILPEEKIKGLIGELVFLRNHLVPKYGGAEAVKFWHGPEGFPQDFSVDSSAVEVKCQMGGTAPTVKISSAEQLSSQMDNLYLFVVSLGTTTGDNGNAINLPLLVEDLKEKLEQESDQALALFQDLLIEAGYYYSDEYMEFNYLLLEEHAYLIDGDFPRICPEDLKAGIAHLTYSINIMECSSFEIKLEEWGIIND